jgi:hypothetical protein
LVVVVVVVVEEEEEEEEEAFIQLLMMEAPTNGSGLEHLNKRAAVKEEESISNGLGNGRRVRRL